MDRRDFLRLGIAAGSIPACAARLVAADATTASIPATTVEPAAVAKAAENVLKQVGRNGLEKSVRLACRWFSDVAQVLTERLDKNDANPLEYPYVNWKGAIRGNYGAERTNNGAVIGKWSFFGPIWHTGQACKALALAARCFNDEKMLDSAKLAAGFLQRHQVTDTNDPDFGMIAGYEDRGPFISNSCIQECCDGLFTLSETTGDQQYAQWATDAVSWIVDKLYMGDGYFQDCYSTDSRKVVLPSWRDRWGKPGRALWDDGVLLKAAKHGKLDNLRKVFFEVADRLLRDEDPPGNWIAYVPCNWREKKIHARQAFWFGRPMWMAYRETGESKYRDCFDRACQWYVRAMRHDGAMMRYTWTDFTADSFGHANSGTGCACMMFRDQYAKLGNTDYLPHLVKGLKYLQSVQFVEAKDRNLRGAVLEKVLPPDRSDASPWFIRDIATSFFVTAASQVLLDASNRGV